jgi:hypothetical protein
MEDGVVATAHKEFLTVFAMHTSYQTHTGLACRLEGSCASGKAFGGSSTSTQRGAVLAEAAIVTPILITFAMLSAYLCEVTLNYMSLAATAHETVDIALQAKAPATIAGGMSQGLELEEADYKTCLTSLEEGTQPPTEICLNIMAQWRSQKLLNSFAMRTRLSELTVVSQVQAPDDELAPRLGITIKGKSDQIFERIFSWVLSTSATSSINTPSSGGA